MNQQKQTKANGLQHYKNLAKGLLLSFMMFGVPKAFALEYPELARMLNQHAQDCMQNHDHAEIGYRSAPA